jgi:hypothetical protein
VSPRPSPFNAIAPWHACGTTSPPILPRRRLQRTLHDRTAVSSDPGKPAIARRDAAPPALDGGRELRAIVRLVDREAKLPTRMSMSPMAITLANPAAMSIPGLLAASSLPCMDLACNALNGCGGGFAFVNGADEVARGNAVTDQTRIDTGPAQRFDQRVVGDARRRPQI